MRLRYKKESIFWLKCFTNDHCIYGIESAENKLAFSTLDVDAKDKKGRTSLHYAMLSGNADIVTRLLEAGADPKSKVRHLIYKARLFRRLPNRTIFSQTFESFARVLRGFI